MFEDLHIIDYSSVSKNVFLLRQPKINILTSFLPLNIMIRKLNNVSNIEG